MGNLTDVQQTILAGQQVHQSTEFQNLNDRAFVDLANLYFGSDFLDALLGSFSLVAIGCGNGDSAVFLDIDLRTGFFGQRTDGGATLTDYVTNLLGVDLHGEQLGRERRHFGFGFTHRFLHLAQNVHTRFLGLRQGHLHDFLGDTLDLDVHLQGSNTVGRTCHLEVHITQVIFVTQDVGQHGKAVAILDQTHGDTCHVRLHWHASIHHGQAAATHRSHRGRAIRLCDFRHHTNGVRKLFLSRQASSQCTLGQTAVADFTALGRTHATHFAGSKGRHVVVEQEGVFEFASQRVDALCIALSTQSGHHQGLCFTTGEQRRAVGTGQHGVADFDGTHRACVAAVDAGLTRQDLRAHNVGFDVEQHVLHLHRIKRHALLCQSSLHVRISCAASQGTHLFVALLVSSTQLGFTQFNHLGNQHFILGRRSPIPSGLATFTHQVVNGVDSDLALLMAVDHRTQHHFFRQLLRFGFHHQHGRLSACNHQIHQRILALCLTGVQHVFAIDVTHAGCTDRAVERNARHRQSCRSGNHGGNISIHFRVQRNGVDDHMHVVVETFGEQRADRTVDQTRSQRLQLRRLGFSLEEAARNLARCVGLLNVVNGQREKVLTRFGDLRAHHRGQHHGVIDIYQHSAGSLACNFAGFHGDRMLAPLESLGHFIEHCHTCTPIGIAGCAHPAMFWRLNRTRCHSTSALTAIKTKALSPQTRLWNDTASLCFHQLQSKKRLS